MMKNRWKCLRCGKYKRKDQRIRKKYCSVKCMNLHYLKSCKYCGTLFLVKHNQTMCKDCAKSRDKLWYNNKLYNKKCLNCGKTFNGTSNSTLCKRCYKKIRKEAFVHKYRTGKRPVYCKRCLKVYKTEKYKISYKARDYQIKGLCVDCYAKWEKKFSDMSRKRMLSKKNPVFKYFLPRNKKRGIGYGVRGLLRSWVKKIRKKYKNKCALCSSTRKLSVHHIIPLRTLIKEEIEKLAPGKTHAKIGKDDILFFKIIENIMNRHTLKVGILLCKKCHRKVDPVFKLLTKNSKRDK